jgi:hypothetical protein
VRTAATPAARYAKAAAKYNTGPTSPLRGASVRTAATPAARYAKAAAKYNTGPTSPALLYQRVDLASLLDMDVSAAVKNHSSRAAQAAAQQTQLEDNERVNWNEIL